jgi:hypothetical protein
MLGSPPVVLVVYTAFGLYHAHRFTPAEEFRRIILAVTVGVIGLVTLSVWSMASLSRSWLALSWTLGVLFALATRRVWHWWVFRSRTHGRFLFPTLIVGTNVEAMHLETAMQHPRFGFRSIGLVATEQSPPAHLAPVVGGIDDLRELIRGSGAECVFVAASALSSTEIAHVAKAVRLEGVEVRVTATLPEMLASRLTVQPIGGMMALSLKPVRLSGTQAGRETCVRPVGRDARTRRALAGTPRDRGGGAPHLAGTGPVPTGPCRTSRPALHDPEVPHDAQSRRRDGRGAAAEARHERPDVQAAGRSPCHARRALPAPLQPRRAAAADQRAPRRDEPRGSAAAAARRGRRVRGLAVRPPRGLARASPACGR